MSVIIASMWMISLVMNNLVAPLLGHAHPSHSHLVSIAHGNLVASLGIAASLLMFLAVRWLRQKSLLDAALLFEIVTGALVASVTQWYPNMEQGPRISWLCLIILIFPSIVPSAPIKILLVSLVVATMDPIAVWYAHLRGVPMQADAFTLVWYFLPTYISVALAVLPAKIIRSLGQEVNKARELGSYQLGDLLGKGGMGEVYRAHHRMLARPAAIKLIRPETLGTDPAGSRITIERFQREAQAAALLRSPHTINLYDFGVTDQGTFYYVMELLEGLDLDSLVKSYGPVPAGRTIFLLRHVCHSLGEAHERGLIHRDIKPSNIFTCRLGLSVDFIKVLDFGLVKTDRESAQGQTVLLTQPDVTTGTPAFMPPEMALGDRPVDRRVDLYALGCVGYWLLTGKLVFEAETPVQMMIQHIQSDPVPPSERTEIEVPPGLDRAILQCLAKRPEDRPPDTATLMEILAEIDVREPWTRERAERWWNTHLPAATLVEGREKTPASSIHAVK
jgi:tRNA A-37 threonylcarbamoyl transferase component Bud32